MEAFRAEVVDKAVPWSDWHGDRILAEHDFASDANAFRRCTDRLTGFISDLSIPTDQTYHVHRFARALAGGEFFLFHAFVCEVQVYLVYFPVFLLVTWLNPVDHYHTKSRSAI